MTLTGAVAATDTGAEALAVVLLDGSGAACAFGAAAGGAGLAPAPVLSTEPVAARR